MRQTLGHKRAIWRLRALRETMTHCEARIAACDARQVERLREYGTRDEHADGERLAYLDVLIDLELIVGGMSAEDLCEDPKKPGAGVPAIYTLSTGGDEPLWRTILATAAVAAAAFYLGGVLL